MTTVYYYGSRGGESAISAGVLATPAAMREPSGDNAEEADESLHTDASDPMTARHVVQSPHCLTHTLVKSDCMGCAIAKRRTSRTLNGVSTSFAKTT